MSERDKACILDGFSWHPCQMPVRWRVFNPCVCCVCRCPHFFVGAVASPGGGRRRSGGGGIDIAAAVAAGAGTSFEQF